MKISLILALLLLGFTSSASAFINVSDYERIKEQPEFANFLYGVAEGFMLAQAIYKKNHLGSIYCPPETLQFSQYDYLELVKQEMASNAQPPGKLMSVVLIESLIKKFPCAKPRSSSSGE